MEDIAEDNRNKLFNHAKLALLTNSHHSKIKTLMKNLESLWRANFKNFGRMISSRLCQYVCQIQLTLGTEL